MRQENLNEEKCLLSYLSRLLDTCEEYAQQRKAEMDRAMEYYNGQMSDLLPEEGRSGSVSRDVRTAIRKLMPSIMRTLLSNERIVQYRPLSPEDEENAAQATEYINTVIIRGSRARRAIFDAIFDALSVKTGILKWVAYRRRKARVYAYADQPASVLLDLEEEGPVAILKEREHAVAQEILLEDSDSQAEYGYKTYDFRLQKIEDTVDIRLESIPRSAFLIYPGATSIEESPIVGERRRVTRSELISQGYDRDLVERITCADLQDDAESSLQIQSMGSSDPEMIRAMEEVLVYEVYVKLDRDGDGIAELYKICLAADEGRVSGNYHLLEIEPVDEAPYAQVVAEREAHEFEGHSIAEDIMDIQRIKTALLRETLDNLYWQNKKQPAIDPSKLTENGLDALYNPAFGKPITLRPGANVHEAVQWMDVPFVADKSFSMMHYLDSEIRNRTGITESAGSVGPDLLQDMTKFAASLVSESGISQAAMIVDMLSGNGAAGGGGIAKAFQGLLKLVVSHSHRPRLVRVGDRWVEYDPAQWNMDMECSVNIGLGAGSKERDLSVLQMILGLQKELLAAVGPQNPFVKPYQFYNVLEKIVETAGFPSADPYFSKPDDQQLAGFSPSEPLSEEIRKLELELQIAKYRADSKMKIEREKLASNLYLQKEKLENQKDTDVFKSQQALRMSLLKHELAMLREREKLQSQDRQQDLEVREETGEN